MWVNNCIITCFNNKTITSVYSYNNTGIIVDCNFGYNNIIICNNINNNNVNKNTIFTLAEIDNEYNNNINILYKFNLNQILNEYNITNIPLKFQNILESNIFNIYLFYIIFKNKFIVNCGHLLRHSFYNNFNNNLLLPSFQSNKLSFNGLTDEYITSIIKIEK